MASNFLDAYKSSSNNLISALNEAIKLLEMKGELFEIDDAITHEVKALNYNNSVKLASLYNKKNDALRIVERNVNSMNASIISSINSLIIMLEEAFEKPSLVYEITLCQGQMDSICDFINKEYLKDDINIELVKQPLLLFILKHNEKRNLPQYEKILNQILELYNVASHTREVSM